MILNEAQPGVNIHDTSLVIQSFIHQVLVLYVLSHLSLFLLASLNYDLVVPVHSRVVDLLSVGGVCLLYTSDAADE